MAESGNRKKWLGATAVILVAFAFALGIAALQLMSNKDFTWPKSTAEIPAWLNRSPNPAFILSAAISAVFSILGAWAAYAQLFGPKPATAEDIGKLGANVTDLSGQIWQEGQASEGQYKALAAQIEGLQGAIQQAMIIQNKEIDITLTIKVRSNA